MVILAHILALVLHQMPSLDSLDIPLQLLQNRFFYLTEHRLQILDLILNPRILLLFLWPLLLMLHNLPIYPCSPFSDSSPVI